jgi:IS5 family transposase
MKRRQAIEPHIGHLKNEGKLGLCRLKGFVGDQINALLYAASYNLKQVLCYLRVLLLQILGLIFLADTSLKINYSDTTLKYR